MRVLIHPADTGACGHYRLIWPGQALNRNGEDVLVADPELAIERWPDEMKVMGKYSRDWEGDEILVGLGAPIPADVFVVQRPLSSAMPGLAHHVRQSSDAALVVELDDDFTNIHAQNISYWATHPTLNPKRSVTNILKTIALADLVTVTTPALRDVYSRHTNAEIRVIPNYVPSWYLTTEKAGLELPEADAGKVLLGWSGSIETHPQDLQVVGGAVAKVLRENLDVKLTVVGTGRGAARAFGTKADGYILTTGWVPLTRYPSVMKELDVGMVPLELSKFNQGKSWLKGLEWASLGVPFVASPTQQYLQLGAGDVAHNPREWHNRLNLLLKNDEYRHAVAERGRMVAEQLVMEDHLDEWMDAWQSARDHKSKSRASSKMGLGGV